MDENSSKYVDQLVINKLLDEKLSKVHHKLEENHDELYSDLYADFSTIKPNSEIISKDNQYIRIESPVECSHEENRVNTITIKEVPGASASIVFLHGLFEDNREIYNFLFSGINKAGLNVYSMTLPFHYERKPYKSQFSGEYFWSANIQRSRRAFRQAVYELYQFYNTVRLINNHDVYICAFSMGGGVALSLASLYKDISRLFVINPVCSLTEIVWDSPLCRTIKNDLVNQEFLMDQLKQVCSVFEPASVKSIAIDTNRICLGYSIYDQITSIEQYKGLISTWNLKNTIDYRAGHLNVLRVPRLANDICAFMNSIEKK
jgi:hypothetical protein